MRVHRRRPRLQRVERRDAAADRQRQPDRRPQRIAPADGFGERQDVRLGDAERRRLRRRGGDRDAPPARIGDAARRQPVERARGVGHRLERGEGLRHDHHPRRSGIAPRQRAFERDPVDIGDDMDRRAVLGASCPSASSSSAGPSAEPPMPMWMTCLDLGGRAPDGPATARSLACPGAAAATSAGAPLPRSAVWVAARLLRRVDHRAGEQRRARGVEPARQRRDRRVRRATGSDTGSLAKSNQMPPAACASAAIRPGSAATSAARSIGSRRGGGQRGPAGSPWGLVGGGIGRHGRATPAVRASCSRRRRG